MLLLRQGEVWWGPLSRRGDDTPAKGGRGGSCDGASRRARVIDALALEATRGLFACVPHSDGAGVVAIVFPRLVPSLLPTAEELYEQIGKVEPDCESTGCCAGVFGGTDFLFSQPWNRKRGSPCAFSLTVSTLFGSTLLRTPDELPSVALTSGMGKQSSQHWKTSIRSLET